MDVSDAVRTVLAVRQFQDKPIPEPLISQIVESGRLSASSMNAQPWQNWAMYHDARSGYAQCLQQGADRLLDTASAPCWRHCG
jgi:hypothetical protein